MAKRYRILTRGDDGNVEIDGRHYYSAEFNDLDKAKKACAEWNKTSFTFIEEFKGMTEPEEIWEEIDD